MPDISMCPGGACPRRDRCYRYRAIPDARQSYFVTPPFSGDHCEYFWDIAALGPSEEAIRTRAYDRWVAAGRPEGDPKDHWLAARAELEAAHTAALTPLPSPTPRLPR